MGSLAENVREAAVIFRPEVETRAPAEQFAFDRATYREQLAYLFDKSDFYRRKLTDAGFPSAKAAGGLDDIAQLPFTEKDEIRKSQAEVPPLGRNQCAALDDIVRVYSTSGTTGDPCFMPLTASDLAGWIEISSRSYSSVGVRRGRRMVSSYNAGPFVAGAALDAFAAMGVCHIPVGTGNTEKLIRAAQLFKPDVLVCTPSYAAYLAEALEQRGIPACDIGLCRIGVAGEPGGGEPVLRKRLEETFGAMVCEAMGIGDIAISLWGECEQQNGMHFSGGGLIHFELIDPESERPVAMTNGATGELIYTALRREAAPMLRYRSRDHVVVWTEPCSCGRKTPRVRCIGRTDDMLIVRGVNVFPSAVRAVVAEFGNRVSGSISIRPAATGVAQEPPLPVVVELGRAETAAEGLDAAIQRAIRDKLVVTTKITLAPFGSLARSEYKTKLVDYADARRSS